MRNTRWKKLLRDIYQTRGRIAMMAVALGVSLFGVGAILSAYSILNREISRNYAGTNPASATVEIDETDDALIRAVRQQPGIAEAEARTTVLARFQVQSGVWQPILLFVVKDFTAMKIGTFKREEGAWPPPRQSMLLERTASKLFGKKTGDSIVVKTPNGTEHEVLISGTTHDPGLAPSWQEHLGYGYITPETLVWLGEQGTLDELKIIVSRDGNDEKKITARALELASWLKSQGHTIKDIQVPPPGKHPHQGIMVALLVMLFIFSVLALVLSAILTATMIAGIMAKEVRQIGVMKAVGARDGQVAGMYITLVLLISGAAVALGLPLGIKAGKGLSEVVSGFLNFTLYSQSIPWWVFSIQIMAGVIVPLMLAMIPISGISKLTVREAISDFGVKQKSFVSTRPNPFLFMFRNVDRTLLLAIRNTF
ncbi:MAG TPA: ABC transporter permease, partial [Spirochaetota bacterium]